MYILTRITTKTNRVNTNVLALTRFLFDKALELKTNIHMRNLGDAANPDF